jgi:hypothetical protein
VIVKYFIIAKGERVGADGQPCEKVVHDEVPFNEQLRVR